jgi:hypothetical protein
VGGAKLRISKITLYGDFACSFEQSENQNFFSTILGVFK